MTILGFPVIVSELQPVDKVTLVSPQLDQRGNLDVEKTAQASAVMFGTWEDYDALVRTAPPNVSAECLREMCSSCTFEDCACACHRVEFEYVEDSAGSALIGTPYDEHVYAQFGPRCEVKVCEKHATCTRFRIEPPLLDRDNPEFGPTTAVPNTRHFFCDEHDPTPNVPKPVLPRTIPVCPYCLYPLSEHLGEIRACPVQPQTALDSRDELASRG